jgi:diadenosine tetraphosphate (Ap4A) HIT family hydrolase
VAWGSLTRSAVRLFNTQNYRCRLCELLLELLHLRRMPRVMRFEEADAAPTRARLYAFAMENCTLPSGRVLLRNDTAIAIRDAYPVTAGHTLVIPRRHVRSFFDTTADERASMLGLLDAAKQQLQLEFSPAGYNIGINDGDAAGQTIGHLHIHLIPRYPGDRSDPRGGVRWVIPDKADYWTSRT